ncbi:MAG: hypothetical protein QOE61_4330 [Micromonosporaceae bacterium]|jgi:hypothetical protein|nr:hypothetical protein [Micromonosporaceae bacterium]
MVGRRIAVGMVVALVMGSLTTVFAYRYAYGTFAWWHGPERISWCGRVYLPGNGTPLTRSAVEQRERDVLTPELETLDPAARAVWTRGHPNDPPPLVEVAKVPPLVGGLLLASLTGTGRGTPCAMVVYLEVDPDAYRTYVLSGGP